MRRSRRPVDVVRVPGRTGTLLRSRRLVLRSCAGLFLVGAAALALSLTFEPGLDDPFLPEHWLEPLKLIGLLGAVYLFVASDLVVTTTHAHISNPLRRVAVPLSHVREVRRESNLGLRTDYGTFWAWGVESGAVFDDGGVGATGDVLDAAIAAAPETDEGPARYRFSSPDVLWWGCLAVAAACSATLYLRG